ncbi:MAG: glycerol-3-phosphate dehydrogenase/oxidase [Spirochaetales bacterium]|nr:glycerol-3-phosphate dehydrogenase/oxidase [Leptospiraceae bacterium]MCP5480319.1 glycerol-3-phosphate dehydrogenase/oxidase [Spirochaetales bacterium]
MKAQPTSAPPFSKRRDLSPLTAPTHDLIIVGGGITGATLLWDASLRGLKAVLLEKNDYASGTSQATSKLIHGGLRYLKNGEFGLVRESLRERRLLARMAPHGVRPVSFLMPIYSGARFGRWLMGLALWIYDLLSFDRNRGLGRDHRLPGARYIGAAEALAEEPGLDARGLKGAYIYYDYANTNPERLCVEYIQGARAHGGQARNYTKVRGFKKDPSGFYNVNVEDTLSGERAVLRARTVVNATGPWADGLEQILTGRIEKHIVRSKGIHLVTRSVTNNRTVVLMRPDHTHLFIIPWRGRSLIGTTDTAFRNGPDRLHISEDEIEAIIADINSLFPGAGLQRSDVYYSYAGLRPLVGGDAKKSTYDQSRRNEVIEHGQNGFEGFFTVLGGKYTTSRLLAEQVLDRVVTRLGKHAHSVTDSNPLPAGGFGSRFELQAQLCARFPKQDARKIRALAQRYGREAENILRRSQKGSWKLPNGEEFYPEEIDHIVLNEQVEQIGDLYFRRSGLGTAGPPSETVNREIVRRVAKLLGWGRSEQKKALQELYERFATGGGVPSRTTA